MILITLIALSLLNLSHASNLTIEEVVDDYIGDLKRHHRDNDTIYIPVKHFVFKRGIGPLSVTGSVTLHDIELTCAIHTLRRTDDVTIGKFRNSTLVTINLDMGALPFSAEGVISFIGLGGLYHWKGKILHVASQLKLIVNSKKQVRLIKFEIKELNEVKLNYEGNTGFLTSMRDYLINQAAKQFESSFVNPLTDHVTQVLREHVRDWRDIVQFCD